MKGGDRLKRADKVGVGVQSKRLHGIYFSLSVSPLPLSRESAFTCAVSKQVARKAAHRNLVKRRCREAVRARLRDANVDRPYALVFRAKPNAKKATFAEINRDIHALFDKIANPR